MSGRAVLVGVLAAGLIVTVMLKLPAPITVPPAARYGIAADDTAELRRPDTIARSRDRRAQVLAEAQAARDAEAEQVAAALAARTPAPTPRPALPILTAYGPGTVLASWYGPGFYGNGTACGQTYSSVIVGVAHRSLPCGTLVTLSYGGATVTVPVIDRGPYIDGRTFDLSAATKAALGCPDLCWLTWR